MRIHFHFHSNNGTSHRTILHECGTVSWPVLNSIRLEANKTIVGLKPIRPLPAPALVNTREHGGYAGTRVGEAQNPGPATHDRDWTVTEQPNAAHTRINDAGDSVPRSQDSVTRGVQNLSISDSLAVLPAPPPSIMRSSRRPPRPKQQPRVPLLCAVWSRSRRSHGIHRRRCLMQHMVQKHGGRLLRPDSVEHLRCLTARPV